MAIREVVESMYEGKCTVSEMTGVKDPITGIVKQTETVVLTDQPCRLSYKGSEVTSIDNGVGVQAQLITLFISPDISIKPGSKVAVTQNNQTVDYKRSGLPSVYGSHQEITLTIFDRYS